MRMTRIFWEPISLGYCVRIDTVDPHDMDHLSCPECGGALASFPGSPVMVGDQFIGWEQVHGCGTRLRVLADPHDD
jgi:hypothetical protein